jgi:UbiD family decarboxylase
MRNIGTYRMQVYDGRTTGMHWQQHKGGAQHYRVAERLGKRLEVAVALGPDPALSYAATAPMPEGLDELLLAGFIRRERVDLVKCRTVDPRSLPTRRSCWKGTSNRASAASRARSATTPASIRIPTTIRCST